MKAGKIQYISQVELRKKGLFWGIFRQCRYLFSWITKMLYCSQASFKRSANTRKTYTFSICAIFRNEATFLREWIEFHLLVGVEHFYLYNNFSEDNYLEILQPYIDSEIVTLTDWPIESGQLSAYLDCFNRYKEHTEWIAYIDLDEFICMRKEIDIKDWIRPYKNYPTVYVNWKMFGISGIMEHDKQKTVIEQYTASWEHLSNAGKSFINTRFNFKEIGCHLSYPAIRICGLPSTILPINEFKKSFHHWVCRAPKRKESGIQLNHYYYRSYSQYLYKAFKRPDAMSPASGEVRRKEGVFELQETRCIAKDFTIQRFLTLLKRNMNK